jgi:hypothetical protein
MIRVWVCPRCSQPLGCVQHDNFVPFGDKFKVLGPIEGGVKIECSDCEEHLTLRFVNSRIEVPQ